jgi:hypothetical protein
MATQPCKGGRGQIEAVATARVHMLKAGWKPFDRDASGNPKWLLGVKHCSLTWTSTASHSETDGIANDGECSSHGRGSNPAIRFAKYGWESAEWLVRASPCSDVPPNTRVSAQRAALATPRCRADIGHSMPPLSVCCLTRRVECAMQCNTVHPPKMSEWRAEHGVA